MTVCWLDIETRSRCELKNSGLYNYSQDPTTQIVIACYATDMGEIKTWEMLSGKAIPSDLVKLLKDPAVEVRAHSAAFERLLLREVWKLDVAPSRWACTAFQARSCSLPGSLADLGRALTANMQKNPRGFQLIMMLSKPGPDGKFNEDKKLYAEFAAYCKQDVGAMRVASLMLPPLDSMARRVWSANETVNDRGLPIDRELCELALRYATREIDAAQARVIELTSGACSSARGGTLTQWVHDNLPPEAAQLMDVTRRVSLRPRGAPGVAASPNNPSAARPQLGEEKKALTLDADTREAIFLAIDKAPNGFADHVVGVLEANDAVMSSSTGKFKRLLEMVSPDGRLRGAFVAGGASGTGRFSSHGCQLHNFPRVTHKDPEGVKALMKKDADLGGPVLEVLKSMLRPAIWPGKGRVIVRGDWSSIEARALPWLTARASAVIYADAFNDAGRDIYLEQAVLCGLGENRQAGKVVVLSLGYGGGPGALASMCRGYDVSIANKKAVVDAWRRANPWAVQWWGEMERTARTSLWSPIPAWVEAGRVGWTRAKDGEVPGLRMMLPSGRLIHYPFAKAEEDGIKYLKAAWQPKQKATEWPRGKMWGGLACENATQACCADLLREALVAAVESGVPICGHVHDELIAEASEKDAPAVGLLLKHIMMTPPEWAAGLPLAVEIDISARYRK